METQTQEATVNVNISLSRSLKAFIDAEVVEGDYGTMDEYVRELVDEAKERRIEERLEQLMLEAIESGHATPMTREDGENIRTEVRCRAEKRSAEKGNQ